MSARSPLDHRSPASGQPASPASRQSYYDGATLAELQEALRRVPAGQRAGDDLIRALSGTQGGRPGPSRPNGPAGRQLKGSTFVEAICWMGACLADALHHAHERGLLHLDLKPSNVLLAADGQPMLLDFHLARPPIARGAAASAQLGGTPGYMPTEQQAVLAAALVGQPAPADVDLRADVYALGVLIYEMLADELPPTDSPGLALRRRNTQVTPGLADVVSRCLAAEASHRYPTASSLAADFRRFLADLPLCGVANRNLPERWRKWRRRRPYVLPFLVLLTAGAGAAGSWSMNMVRQFQAAESAAREGEDYLLAHRYPEALKSFKYGIALADAVPFSEGLSRRLRDGTNRAEKQAAVAELHALAEQLRPLDGIEWLPADQLTSAEQQCRQLGERRTEEQKGSGVNGRDLSPNVFAIHEKWPRLLG